MIELFKALEPYTGVLAALLIVAIVGLVLYIRQKDKQITQKDLEIERLRVERNTAMEKKDIDLKESNQQVISLHKTTLETIGQFGKEAEVRAVKDEAKTDAILETLKGMQSVLININKK